MIGSTIRAYKNGDLQFTYVDETTPFTTGNPGIGADYGTGDDHEDFGFKDFFATDAPMCRYSLTDQAYADMTGEGSGTFDTVAAYVHSKSIPLNCGNTYIYYSRCIDILGNASTASQVHTFTIAPPIIPETGFIEAESGTIVTSFASVADAAASGGYYVTPSLSAVGTLTLTVPVSKTATYEINAMTFAAAANNDSMFLTIDAGTEMIWDWNPEAGENYGMWRKDKVTNRGTGGFDSPQYDPYQVYLTAGNHTFVFRAREAGARLDYIYLTEISPPGPTESGTYYILGTGNTVYIGSGNTIIIE
jgi:hypothetical protein